MQFRKCSEKAKMGTNFTAMDVKYFDTRLIKYLTESKPRNHKIINKIS